MFTIYALSNTSLQTYAVKCMFSCTWYIKQTTVCIIKKLRYSLQLSFWNNSENLCNMPCTQVNWSFSWLLLFLGLVLQVSDDARFYVPNVQWLAKAVETKHFFAVTLNWIPTWVFNLLLHKRKSRPDESLSLEMSARFHSNLAAFWNDNLPFF